MGGGEGGFGRVGVSECGFLRVGETKSVEWRASFGFGFVYSIVNLVDLINFMSVYGEVDLW